ncbi:MAG TPA: hypothetical protein EYG03_09565 [Planctomycetes bacterium]|nr:hypothetical protein [Fuerstiella sp.]HIK92211.1 hypothetical protein [Planctomycetota bacterium]
MRRIADRRMIVLLVLLTIGFAGGFSLSERHQPVATEVLVLTTNGTAYERGFQHGIAYRLQIREVCVSLGEKLQQAARNK